MRGDVEPLPSTFLGDEGSPQRGELHLYLHLPFPIVILLPPPSPFSPPSLLSSLPASLDPSPATLTGNKRYLFLQVRGGRAFLDHLQDGHTPHSHASLTLHALFCGQRFRTRPAPCSCEPNLRESFLFELVKRDRRATSYSDRMMSYTDALSISESVHLVVMHRDANRDCRHVGTHHLVWRPVLAA